MAKQKFYAVRVGRTPGIYQTWNQAEEQIKGFSGAEHKTFFTEKEAIKYLSFEETKESIEPSDKASDMNRKIELEIKNLQAGEVIAFVDGSHSLDADEKEKYSFGVFLITNESEDSLITRRRRLRSSSVVPRKRSPLSAVMATC